MQGVSVQQPVSYIQQQSQENERQAKIQEFLEQAQKDFKDFDEFYKALSTLRDSILEERRRGEQSF